MCLSLKQAVGVIPGMNYNTVCLSSVPRMLVKGIVLKWSWLLCIQPWGQSTWSVNVWNLGEQCLLGATRSSVRLPSLHEGVRETKREWSKESGAYSVSSVLPWFVFVFFCLALTAIFVFRYIVS